MPDRWIEAGGTALRKDGLVVTNGVDGLIIIPASGGLPIDFCPCCGKAFKSVHAARLVADMLYPTVQAPADGG